MKQSGKCEKGKNAAPESQKMGCSIERLRASDACFCASALVNSFITSPVLPHVQPRQGQLRSFHERLMKEKEQLRREKEQIRKKEEQLREKQLVLLCQQQTAALGSRRGGAAAGKCARQGRCLGAETCRYLWFRCAESKLGFSFQWIVL